MLGSIGCVYSQNIEQIVFWRVIQAVIAGAASALIGSLQYGSGIISSLLLAWLETDTPVTMISIMTIFTVLSAAMVFIPHRGNQ